MLFAAEQLNALAYSKQPGIEGVNIRVHETVARQLGLRDGQVVQAVVETRGETSRLVLNGRTLELPNALKFAQGDAPYFRVLPSTLGGKVLHLVRVSDPSASSQRVAPSSEALSGRLMGLLAQPVQLARVADVLRSPALAAVLSERGMQPVLSMLLQMQPSIAVLSADAIQRAVLQSGLWAESRLGRGVAPEPDLKQWLRMLLGSLPRNSPLGAAVGQAIDSLEAQQLDTLRAQTQRELSFAVMVPFLDAEPVELSFFRAVPKRKDDSPPFVVNARIESVELGSLSLKTVLSDGGQIAVTIWADSEDVVLRARAGEGTLRDAIHEAGLTLVQFAVFNAPRPSPAERIVAPGYLVDVDA